MRRVMMPQRDAIGRLARREFPMISDEMAYRFRDVYDHVVRFTEEAILFQDRVTGIFEVNLSDGLESPESGDEGADGDVHDLPAADRADRHVGHEHPAAALSRRRDVQFWWVGGIMVAISVAMLAVFRRNKWICMTTKVRSWKYELNRFSCSDP